MESWILLLIPATSLFFWYWGFWRNLDKDKSQIELSKGNKGNNFIDNGFEVKSSASKRYIQQRKPAPIKTKSTKRSAAKSGSAGKKGKKQNKNPNAKIRNK